MTPALMMIVPSRGRPHSILEMYNALHDTGTSTDTHVVFVLDADDPTVHTYLANIDVPPSNPWVYALVREDAPDAPRRRGVVDPLNFYATYAAATVGAFAVGFMGDDHRPRTQEWDKAYIDTLEAAGTGIVYGNDLFQRANIPTQVAMTADIVNALGYMAPPQFQHLYVDNVWKALGEGAGCLTYLDHVVVEHMHPAAGKGTWDAGYGVVNAPEIDSADRELFRAYVADGLAADVAKIRSLMEITK